MDKFSKTVFGILLALLLLYAVGAYLEVDTELYEADVRLAELRSRADELRRENELLREQIPDVSDGS